MAKHSEAVAGVFAGAEKDIDKYMALRGLRVRDPDAYYRLLTKHTEEILPYVYTPTVGQVCRVRKCHHLSDIEVRFQRNFR